MNRGNQNFVPPENWRSRQDYGLYPGARRNNWNNLQTISPPLLLPEAGPLNPREVRPEPWRFQERSTSAPVAITSFPGQRYNPDQIINVDNDAERNTYQRQRRSSPDPSPTFQGRWNLQAPEEESRLTQDEQKQALNKLKKEVYFPILKRGKRPNLYFREHSMNSFAETGKEYDEEGKRCAICLDDFEPREVVTSTPCKHMFHEDCIIPWVKSQGRCPVCRYAICERFRENAASSNNMVAHEHYEIDLISIIRAMEEAFIPGIRRILH